MDKLGADGAGGKAGREEPVEQLLQPEVGEGGRTAQDQHGRGPRMFPISPAGSRGGSIFHL
jgi:hypothetical protein